MQLDHQARNCVRRYCLSTKRRPLALNSIKVIIGLPTQWNYQAYTANSVPFPLKVNGEHSLGLCTVIRSVKLGSKAWIH